MVGVALWDVGIAFPAGWVWLKDGLQAAGLSVVHPKLVQSDIPGTLRVGRAK